MIGLADRFRELRRTESGFTLIELLVASTILAIVLGILTYAMATGLTSERGVSVRTTDANNARVAMDRITGLLSEAVNLNDNATSPFVSATTTSVSFYSNVDTIANGASAVSAGPLNVQLTEGTDPTQCPSPDYCLIETDTPTVSGTITLPGGTTETAWVPGPTSTQRILAHGLSQAPAQQLFTYYQTTTCNPDTDSTCNAASPRRTVTALPTSAGSVSSANLGNIDTVDIFIADDAASTPNAPATSLENRVSLAGAQQNSTSSATS